MPRVSVLMPVYNGEKYLAESVESVLSQTFTSLELLVVNDGSDDSTGEIAASFDDPRIRVLNNDVNHGIEYSLNRGLGEAVGEFIARIDSDDICHPERLAKQVDVMTKTPGLVLLGSSCNIINNMGVVVRTDHQPSGDTEIRWKQLFLNSFAHSTVMFRHELYSRSGLRYNSDFYRAEDYELWSRMLELGRGGNLPEALVSYRLHHSQVSQAAGDTQAETTDRISRANLANLGVEVTLEEARALRKLLNVPPDSTCGENMKLFRLIFSVIDKFERDENTDNVLVKKIRRQWKGRLLRAAGPIGMLNSEILGILFKT